jgi:hypothetical protein
MITRLKEFLTQPFFDLEEKTRLGRLVYTILWFAMIMTAIPVTITLVSSRHNTLPGVEISVAIFLLYAVCLFLLRRGYVHLSATLLVFALGGILTIANLVFGGIHELVFSGYVVVILMASLLISWTAGVIVFFLSILTHGVFLILGSQGLLPQPAVQAGPLAIWISGTTVFSWVMFLVYIGNRNLREALHRALRNEHDLKKSRTGLKPIRQTWNGASFSSGCRRCGAMPPACRKLAAARPRRGLVRRRFGFYHAGIFMIDSPRICRAQIGHRRAGKQMIANV